MDYLALKAELEAGHPSTGAYSADSVVAATEINTVNRTGRRTNVSGDELFSATDSTEFANLSADKKVLWVSFCGRDQIAPYGISNVAFVSWVFGAGATVAALAALRAPEVSRAVELKLGKVTPGAIEHARTL